MQPVRKTGSVFLEKIILVDPVGIALERERTALQMRHQQVSHAVIKVDEVALGVSVSGIEDLLQVGEFELMAVDGERGFGSSPAPAGLPFPPA